ncbi:hypothetical protein [Kordia sp.]|uniref:hypothetical protein n=1 Tax=Kordia sp. TaxID=1965332 RepID=UPI003B5CBB68
MKKRDLKSKLIISRKTISNFQVNATKGGTRNTFNCGASNNAMCTFLDACFSKGPGCSRWQVC